MVLCGHSDQDRGVSQRQAGDYSTGNWIRVSTRVKEKSSEQARKTQFIPEESSDCMASIIQVTPPLYYCSPRKGPSFPLPWPLLICWLLEKGMSLEPCRTSLVAQMVKRLPTTRETRVWSLGQEDPLKEMAPHSSTLAWKIPWTGEPGRLQSMGSKRARHDWATSLHFIF